VIEENIKVKHAEGLPWKIVGRFSTFEQADSKRIELLADDFGLQIKVHYQGHPNNHFYAVKMRLDPAIVLEEEVCRRRAEKKRRKANLNKKRRKK